MRASRFVTLAATVVALSAVLASCSKDTTQPPVTPPPPGGTPPGPIPPPPPPPPSNSVTLWAAGNITACNPGNHDEGTANLIKRDTTAWKVLVLGDMARSGMETDYQNCYAPSWGAMKDRSYPVLGNHEYDYFELIAGRPAGADTLRKANGSFAYWGAALGTNGENGRGGYYAVDYGNWRIVVVNDNWNRCNTGQPGGTDNCAEAVHAGPGSDYFVWIANELSAAKAARKCTMVAFHSPRFFSSTSPGFTVRSQRSTLWQVLDATNGAQPARTDIVLNGQEHHYERLAPMTWDGTANPANGIRSFNIGTGGESLDSESSIIAVHPNSEVRIFKYGALRLSLGDTGYKWAFMLDDGSPAADTGSGTCH